MLPLSTTSASLAEIEDKKPTQRLIAVINYLEEDDDGRGS